MEREGESERAFERNTELTEVGKTSRRRRRKAEVDTPRTMVEAAAPQRERSPVPVEAPTAERQPQKLIDRRERPRCRTGTPAG
jgi:hypothetical protein